jgi:hypothetical protein
MLKADLVSGISYVDEAGHYCDFHSLHHTTGSLLAASGVHPKVAQSIMRHSDINLTMSRYSHVLRGQKSEAIAGLPNLSLPSSQNQQAKATGTDGGIADCTKTDPKKLTPFLTPMAFSGCNRMSTVGNKREYFQENGNSDNCLKMGS